MWPWILRALWTTELASGAVTSSESHTPPSFLTSETRSGVLDGLREVAITLWPARRACKARVAPKPEEQPVMNQTGADGADMFVGGSSGF